FFPTVSSRNRQFLSGIQGFRQHNVEIGIVVLVLLDEIELLPTGFGHALHPQRPEKVEGNDSYTVRLRQESSGGLPVEASAFIDRHIQLLFFYLNGSVPLGAASLACGNFCSQVERCPHSKLVFIPGQQRYFLRGQFNVTEARQSERIDGKQHLAAIALAVNEGVEQSARRGAEHILQDAGMKVVMQFVSKGSS